MSKATNKVKRSASAKSPTEAAPSHPVQLDRNVETLVEALNALPGVQTIGSCGGHANPSPAQWREGTFYVKFHLEWTVAGKFSLEFLAWAINNWHRKKYEGRVTLLPVSPFPAVNEPGSCLAFVIEGNDGVDPRRVGKDLLKVVNEDFVGPTPRRRARR